MDEKKEIIVNDEASVDMSVKDTVVSKAMNITDENSLRLLTELVELQKKTAKRQLIAMTASVVTAVCFAIALIIIVPMMTRMSKEVSAMVADTGELIKEADGLLGQAGDSLEGIDNMIGNVNKVVVDNTQAATEAISNIQNIDIDQLNEAIRNLSDAVEPLAKLNNSIGNGVSGLFGGNRN